MTEKRYYWLKLKSDFFMQKEIKKLRSIAGGDTYTIIYLKMQLKSLTDGGKLYHEGYEDDFASELALDLDEKVDNVKVTLMYLLKHNLVEKTGEKDGEHYLINATNENTGTETSSAKRVRKHRAKGKLLQSNEPVTPVKQIVNGELEKELEIDIEKEKKVDTNTPTKMFTYVYKHLLNKQPTKDKILNFNTNLLPLLSEFSLYEQIFTVRHLMHYSQSYGDQPFFREWKGIGADNFKKLIEDVKGVLFLNYFSDCTYEQMRKYFDYHDRTDKRLTVKTSNMKQYLEAANIANTK